MMPISSVNAGAARPLTAAEKVHGGGQPKIYFDDPERAPDSPERPEDPLDAKACGQDKDARGPEKKGEKEHVCIGSTDKVDREIERLRKKKEELEQRISTNGN